MTTTIQELDLARELQPTVERALERHLTVAKEWFPHEYVPWARGRDFIDEPFEPDQSTLPAHVSVAVQLNLLTEDNLPGYHREIYRSFGTDGPWQTWIDRWTAEEGRHAIVIRDYLTVVRAVDPRVLEQERMATMEAGFYAPEKDLLRTAAYVSLQELATRVSHRNTGLQSGDPLLDKLLGRVAADENLHMIFYRDLFRASLELAPAQAMEALADEIEGFAMPGTGIPGFLRKAATIAKHGIYDLPQHRDAVLRPLLEFWKIFELSDLDGRAEAARGRIALACEQLDAKITKMRSRAARVAG